MITSKQLHINECIDCGGTGYIIHQHTRVIPECCRVPLRDGTGYDNPNPKQIIDYFQEPCHFCEERNNDEIKN